MNNNQVLSLLIIIILSAFLLPVSGSGLSVTPAKFTVDMDPSQSFSNTVTIQNSGNEPFQIEITPKREQTNGIVEIYSDDGIATWISVETNNFILNPGETKNVAFTINAPAQFDYNDAKGVLMITGTPVSSQDNSNSASFKIHQGIEIAVPINVGLPGPIIESISLLDYNTSPFLLTYMPGIFNYHIKNNGTVTEKVNASTQIKGWFNEYQTSSTGEVIPGDENYLKNSWEPDIFDFGLYSVETNITYGKYGSIQNIMQKNDFFVLPIWLIIIVLLIILAVVIRKKEIKSPIVIQRRK